MRLLLAVLLLLPLFRMEAHALSEADAASSVFGLEKVREAAPEQAREIGGELNPARPYDAAGAIARLWARFLEEMKSQLAENLRFAVSLIVLCFFCALATSLCADAKIRTLMEIAACCPAAWILTGAMDSLIAETTEAIYTLSDYSKAALPVVYTAAAASGAPSSAAARYAAVSFALDVLLSGMQRLILPLISAYLSATVANTLFPNAMLKAAASLSRWAAKTAMTGASLVFTTYIGMTGAISGAVDAAAVKTTRSLISGALPVVGGMISDVSAMVLSAAGIVRSCAGAFGLVAVCAICLGPFAMLWVKTLLLKAVSLAAEAAPCPRLSALFAGISGALAMLMGLLGACGILLFLSFSLGMRAVSGV